MRVGYRFVVGIVILSVVAPVPTVLAQISGQPTSGGGVPVGYANGPTIVPQNSGGTVNFNQAFVSKPTKVEYRSAAGTITASSNGPTSVGVTQINGQYTKTSDITTNGNAVTINPDDKPAAVVDGQVSAVEWQSASGIAVGDGAVDFRYAASGSGTITLNNLPPSQSFDVVTSTSLPLGSVSSDASGTASFDVASTSGQLVGVRLFEASDPTVANPQASPNDDQSTLTNPPISLSVPVDDPDLGSGVGDRLTVEVYVDGSRVDSQTVTSATTVSTTVSSVDAGSHKWYVEVSDGYGNTVQSDTFEFVLPGELKIYSEQNPNNLLTNTPTSVNVTFFGSDRTIRRTTTNGVVDFAGLPADQPFTVRVDTKNYTRRTVVLPSLIQQQEIYLLKEDTSTVRVRFRLQDSTGTFTSTSELIIEKPITRNNTTEYDRLVADEFGSDGVIVNLEKDVRYNLRVKSDSGDVSQLGSFDALLNETIILEPSAAAVQDDVSDDTLQYAANYSSSQQQIDVRYADPSESTETLSLRIVKSDGTIIRSKQTYTDTSSLSISVPVGSELEQSATVFINGTQSSGNQITIRESVGPQQNNIVPTGLSPVWVQVGSGAAILLVGGVFSVLNVGIGAVATSVFAGLLWFLGLLSPIVSGSAVALALGISTVNLLLRD